MFSTEHYRKITKPDLNYRVGLTVLLVRRVGRASGPNQPPRYVVNTGTIIWIGRKYLKVKSYDTSSNYNRQREVEVIMSTGVSRSGNGEEIKTPEIMDYEQSLYDARQTVHKHFAAKGEEVIPDGLYFMLADAITEYFGAGGSKNGEEAPEAG